MGIGAVDTTESLSMRMLGMHGAAFANYAVEDCDCLLALGARFDDRVAGNVAKFAGNAKFIAHFDIDASEIDKVKHGALEPRGADVQCAAGLAGLRQAHRTSSAIGRRGMRTASNCARAMR